MWCILDCLLCCMRLNVVQFHHLALKQKISNPQENMFKFPLSSETHMKSYFGACRRLSGLCNLTLLMKNIFPFYWFGEEHKHCVIHFWSLINIKPHFKALWKSQNKNILIWLLFIVMTNVMHKWFVLCVLPL